MESFLREKVKKLSLEDQVYFMGTTNDILKYYHNTSIFILPSLAEGMSNSLLEAMACGLPIVATRIGGNTDLIRDGENGILVPPKDPTALSQAIIKLIEDNELARRLARQARKDIEENYSLDIITESYLKLYHRLLSDPLALKRYTFLQSSLETKEEEEKISLK